MGAPKSLRRPRVVLDTNVLVSALVLRGEPSWLREAWQAGRLRPLASRATASELIRVLGYPKFRLSPNEREALLADYLPWCESVVGQTVVPIPECRDVDDRIFLQLAATARADALISGDRDLLELAPGFSIPILSPSALRRALEPCPMLSDGERGG